MSPTTHLTPPPSSNTTRISIGSVSKADGDPLLVAEAKEQALSGPIDSALLNTIPIKSIGSVADATKREFLPSRTSLAPAPQASMYTLRTSMALHKRRRIRLKQRSEPLQRSSQNNRHLPKLSTSITHASIQQSFEVLLSIGSSMIIKHLEPWIPCILEHYLAIYNRQ